MNTRDKNGGKEGKRHMTLSSQTCHISGLLHTQIWNSQVNLS